MAGALWRQKYRITWIFLKTGLLLTGVEPQNRHSETAETTHSLGDTSEVWHNGRI